MSIKGIKYAPPIPAAYRLEARAYDGRPPLPEPGSFEYTVIASWELQTGGAQYPFLSDCGRNWTIITQALDALDEPVHPAHALHMQQPTLRYVREDAVVSLYVDGMTEAEFCRATGLELHPQVKGQYVLSKRLSRVLRPHYVSGHFDPSDVRVRYLDDADFARFSETVAPGAGGKVWDGAGLVSRDMLKKMVIPPDAPPGKRARLERELATASRVQFTLMTERGQDKGHAMVADRIELDGVEYDFLLPRDTKAEVTLSGDQTWVGFDFAHGKDHMRIDVQSAINLYPFFEPAQYARWLEDAGEVFSRAVESGDVVAAMARIRADETLDDVESWGTRLFFASGGQPLDFQHHTRSLMNRRLDQLNYAALGRLRMEIPGGRYYVMPQALARAAGYDDVAVPRGGVHLDHRRGTAWVNDQDWLGLEDSPADAGIAKILGGADHDDALWAHVFDDHDGRRKVLCWRSPNQLGEYVLLEPTPGSDLPAWTTTAGDSLSSVPGDSRRLPERIDHRQVEYTRRVDHEHAGVYTLDEAIARAQANAGALGMTCNTLMVSKAVRGDLPEGMPAPLEDIIDAQVKTGADTSHIVDWNYEYIAGLLRSRTLVPELLIGDVEQGVKRRLSVDWRDRDHQPPPPQPTRDHWLDRTVEVIRAHARDIEARRDALAARALPPQAVFDSVFADPDSRRLVREGGEFNGLYARTLKETGDDYEAARDACELYLDTFPPDRQRAILRGAIYSVYLRSETRGQSRSDASVWQKGRLDPLTGERARGIEHRTIEALREVGALDEISETPEGGLLAYPGAAVARPRLRTLGVEDAWLHRLKAEDPKWSSLEGTRKEQMRKVPKLRRASAKQAIETFSRHDLPNTILTVGLDAQGRLAAYLPDGNLLGTLQHAEDLQPGDRLRLPHSLASDGNLRATCVKLPPAGE